MIHRLIAIFFFISWCSSLITYSQSVDISFRHLTIEDGLSQMTVFCIYQDAQGFIWFGTNDGLNRFDGYTFKIFKSKIDNKNSLPNNSISTITSDNKHRIWIGTQNGLCYFNSTNQTFTRFSSVSDNPNTIPSQKIRCVFIDNNNILWVGTNRGLCKLNLNTENPINQKTAKFTNYVWVEGKVGGISGYAIKTIYQDKKGVLYFGTDEGGYSIYHPESDSFTKVDHTEGATLSMNDDDAYAIEEDNKGRLWVGTYGKGVNILNKAKTSFEYFEHDPENTSSLNGRNVSDIHCDRYGNMWITTIDGGLNLYKPQTNTFQRFINNQLDPNSLSNNRAWCIFESNDGVIWIGTSGGISYFKPGPKKFNHIKSQPTKENSLPNNYVWCFFEDSKRNIWVGTNGGLSKFNRKQNSFTTFTNSPDNPKSLSNNRVKSINEDDNGYIWIGTNGGGLNRFAPQTETFMSFKGNYYDDNTISSNFVWHICKDGNKFWIAAQGGLNLFEPDSFKFRVFQHNDKNKNSISNNSIKTLLVDSKGTIWAGIRGGGLNRLIKENDTNEYQITRFLHDEDDYTSLSDNYINCIFEDSRKNLWIATANTGLNLFNKDTETFKRYTKDDGLPDNSLYGILEDNKGCLWISTNYGISKFNPETESFQNYTNEDGLQSNEFNGGAYYKLSSGEMLFGGINGFNIFHPDSIRNDTFNVAVIPTKFLINYNEVTVGIDENGRQILDNAISFQNEIVLDHTDKVITFEFASLHYLAPMQNKYKYMLEGFDKDWISANSLQRRITYTNLAPGNYTLKINGTNNDGFWSKKPFVLKIKMLPPYWESWWFRTIFVVLIVGSAVAFYVIRLNIIKQQRNELERLVSKRTKQIQEKNVELQEQKDEINEQALKLAIAYKDLELRKDLVDKQHEQIKASIRYAQTIQNAILPIKENMEQFFDSFVIFRPKDIVSGDFYWFSYMPDKENEQIFVAAVDCTGHGVPGAFMSLIGSRMINEIVNERRIFEPEIILTALDREIKKALKQRQTENNDGLDICFVKIEGIYGQKFKVTFCGAKRPLFHYATKKQELTKIKGNRKSIGGMKSRNKLEFKSTVFEIEKGDILYLTSDGYTDQQGPDRKRFGTDRLEKELRSYGHLPLEIQKQKLETILEKYMGDVTQRDDITIFAVRF